MPRIKERVLPQTFYARDPRLVARELLGKVLVRTLSGRAGAQRLSGKIVEVEVYLGEGDLAAHSTAGKTARNEVLFGPPGHAYVYFIYGAHYCLNFSCLPQGQAGCVLLRAVEPLEGIETMAEARGVSRELLRSTSGLKLLTSGPGRVCEALAITREGFNGQELYREHSPLKIVDHGMRPGDIRESTRIGITKSSDMPLRYFLPENIFVSGKRNR
jgi:DNA-3-methyladenine glycosylase